MRKFGLRNKESKKLVGFSTYLTAASDFCVETTHTLDCGEDNEWLVDTPENAEFVRLNTTPWYNSGYDTPQHPTGWDPEKFEVVMVEMMITPVEVRIPTTKEMIAAKYRESNPAHYKSLMELEKAGKLSPYSLYELRDFLRSQS